jgi:hypothetical protein
LTPTRTPTRTPPSSPSQTVDVIWTIVDACKDQSNKWVFFRDEVNTTYRWPSNPNNYYMIPLLTTAVSPTMTVKRNGILCYGASPSTSLVWHVWGVGPYNEIPYSTCYCCLTFTAATVSPVRATTTLQCP